MSVSGRSDLASRAAKAGRTDVPSCRRSSEFASGVRRSRIGCAHSSSSDERDVEGPRGTLCHSLKSHTVFKAPAALSTLTHTLHMPLTIPPSVDAIIMGFDASNAPLKLMDVGTKLSIERQAMKERRTTKEEDFGLWCELAVFYLRPSFDDGENPWNSFFRPMSSMLYENGVTVYSPDIVGADADAVDHWSRRAQELKHPVLRARYADIVWEFGRLITKVPKRDVAMARLAIDAYIETAVRRLADNFHSAFTDAQRAVDLASRVGDQGRIDAARVALLGLHAEIMQEAKGYLWARAFDHLVDHRKAGTTPAEIAGLVMDLEIVLARVSDSTKPETFDPHSTRDAAQRLARHYIREGKPDEVKRVQTVTARSFEFIAGQGGAMLAASFLQDSLDAYKQAGLHDEAERIRVALQAAIRDSKEEMTQHSTRIEIPKEAMDKTLAAVVVDDVGQTFANIAAAFIPKIENMEAQVAKLAKDAPLFAMIPHQIFAEDHVAAKVGSVEDDESGRLLRQTQQTLQFNLPFLHACMQASIQKHQTETGRLHPVGQPARPVRWRQARLAGRRAQSLVRKGPCQGASCRHPADRERAPSHG
jgi:hypothetical protein